MISEHNISNKVSSKTVATSITAYKRGDVGMVSMWGVSVAANANGITIGTLPAGYRPSGNTSFQFSTTVRGNVYPDGTIAVWNMTSSNASIYVSATYVLA